MVEVRDAVPGDIGLIADLFEEMDQFYGAAESEPRDRRLEQIGEVLLGDQPVARALLAWRPEELIGIATYSFLWPAVGLTSSLYLKELYVAKAYRRQGIGKVLMTHLGRIALDRGCSRIEWTADHDNTQARSFYKSLGASEQPGKLFHRVEGTVRIQRLVVSDK